MYDTPARPHAHRFTLGGNDLFTDPQFWEGCLTKRVVAYVIDLVVLTAIGATLWVVMILSLGLLAPLTALLWAITPIAYHSILVSQNGATVGQNVVGLRVVDANRGNNPSLLQAFLSTCLFYISLSLAMVPLLYCLFDPQNRLLHDILSNTRTIRAEAEAP